MCPDISRKRDAFTDIHILGIMGHWEEEYRQLPGTWELVPVEEEGGGIWVEWQEVLRFQTINIWRSSPLGFVHALRTGGIFRPSGGSTVLDREVRPRIETPYTTDMVLDDIQTCLDTAGFVPGFGEPFDAASSVISLARGDYTGFGLGMAAMWPVGGQAAGAAKLSRGFTKLVDPSTIKFTQSTANINFSNGGTINRLAAELKNGKSIYDVPTIRVVEFDGALRTLDNRRLLAFQTAGLQQIPVQVLSFQTAGLQQIPVQVLSLKDPLIWAEFRSKNSPINGGRNIVVISTRKGRGCAERLLRKYGKIR